MVMFFILGFFSTFSGALCAAMTWYFLWKYFVLYLPNKALVDACVPSGGTCSIDGFANLEISGPSALISGALALGFLLAGLWLFRRAGASA